MTINTSSLANVNEMNTGEENPSIHLRPFRSFRSNEEYLWAMKEDLAEWLNSLYDLNVSADNLIEKLETGVILCRHANNVISKARESGHNLSTIQWNLPSNRSGELPYRSNAKPKTFQARDNVSNFISWCKSLKIHECLLFETDDLVLGKNEKSFILCLLEVCRKCLTFGMTAPLIIQMEQEIERDEQRDSEKPEQSEDNLDSGCGDSDTSSGCQSSCETDISLSASDTSTQSTQARVNTNDLRCLHERVVDLLDRCTCPSQFPMVKVADGKYRVGNTKVLIYVRILRNHVMVRVGGGWDTLGHYLDRHDPCRCRNALTRNSLPAAKISLISKSSPKGPQLWINYNRPYPPGPQYNSYESLRCDSTPILYPNLKRRDSIGMTESSCSLNSFSEGSDRQPSRSSHYSDDSSCSSSNGTASSGDISPRSDKVYPTKEELRRLRFRSNYQNKSGIACYVGLGNGQRSAISRSCTNLRWCHQSQISTFTPKFNSNINRRMKA
ncbi:GAS2-like protein pickled eggs [Brevipalpus obovatus]|uniref:GAS2-like protein pickled eggs n=1 Tax=Brevipalpus obovatus TaxID=246614 RepID=UPI003D9F9348